MHNVEFDQYDHTATLTPKLSTLLLTHPLEPTTWQAMQQELNAYAVYDPKTFIGIVYHEDGTGPEKPFFQPEGDDWHPIVQAVARIGCQAQYWEQVTTALHEKRLKFSDIMSANIQPIYPAKEKGRVIVSTYSNPDSLAYIAEKRGDTHPRFPQYINLVNYGGDADFYSPSENHMFPIDVRDKQGVKTYVTREELGISNELIIKTWNSWDNLHKVETKLFQPIFKEFIVHLPWYQFEFFNNKIHAGKKYAFIAQPLVDLMIKYRDISEEEVDQFIDNIKQYIDYLSEKPLLIQAYDEHAKNITSMYKVAKTNRSDVYHY